MPIIVNLDVMMAKRKISLGELETFWSIVKRMNNLTGNTDTLT